MDGHIYGLVQDCSISIANAPDIVQYCTKPLIWTYGHAESWKYPLAPKATKGNNYLVTLENPTDLTPLRLASS